ncbi:chromatin modification-related protein EAF7-domain-containing protein [Absidia repens]|uniref:Chromatin modification-related protein EAF7-domain-containing protein n=1 Tax=Absidia repens TaxID=90262 RepID=A0A1X2IZC0_9FUNG|nr:chromatin modification-related protein EAF7-domain-containing protein [Absidia repens]
MSDIKTDIIEQSLSTITKASSEGTEDLQSTEWDASMEIALLNAIASCKPVGLHRHFRIMCVQRQFNQSSPSQCSISEIWDRLREYYGMNTLNELEKEEKEADDETERQQGLEGRHEFSLPLPFNSDKMIFDHQRSTTQANSSAIGMPLSSQTRVNQQDVSPAVTESSVASTPEPDEATPSRRTGRSTRKSDIGTPEPAVTRSSISPPPSIFSSPSPSYSNRRSGRASSVSKNNNTATATSMTIRRQSKRK